MRSQRLCKPLVLATLGVVLGAGQAWADVYGRIRGTATDPSGAVVPGVAVTVTNVATGVKARVTTSPSGTFEVLNLQAPGNYNVTAEASGFRKFEARDLPLALNQIYVLNVPLELGQTSQEVTVEANGAQVESTRIELGTTVNSRSIVDLPLNGRNWVQLQQLQPGVVAASDGRGSYATNDSQADQNSYLINGTDNNDFPLNTVQVTPRPDAIAEFNFGGAGLYSTGDPGADFLLGVPDNYTQGSGDILNERTQEYYAYFQDQWKIKPNLTLTYGVGWSIDTPAVDNYHNNHAGVDYLPGMQSLVFPSAPTGYVFQGDPGVNAFGTTHHLDFGPRLGFAYRPNWRWLQGARTKPAFARDSRSTSIALTARRPCRRKERSLLRRLPWESRMSAPRRFL